MDLKNLKKPAVLVRHADLKTAVRGSAYKRLCPVCKTGMLMVTRNRKTMKLEAIDRCTECYQEVRYIDIANLRKMEGDNG